MSPYRHLVCPVDFSDVSRMALEWSLGFAKEIGARLTVLHVVDTGLLNLGNLVPAPQAVADMRRRALAALSSWERELDLSAARVELREGAPAETIPSLASEEACDLLVMGTHGLSGFQRLLLGSVTEKVIHRVNVPMLTVSSRLGGREVRELVRPRTIAMGLDLGPDSGTVVRHGVWLAEHYQATLLAVHAVPIPQVILADGTASLLAAEQLQLVEQSLIEDRKQELQSILPESVGTAVEALVRVATPFELLLSVVRERSADLLVVGPGRGVAGLRWLGSTTHKMVRSAECPVLIAR